MTKQLAEAGKDYFRGVVSPIEDHPDWNIDEAFGASISQAVEQAAQGTGGEIGELRFDHGETDGKLYARLPDIGTSGAMELLLEQPLDPELDPIDSQLAEDIGDAHQSTAASPTTPYITAKADPYTILVASIPVDYTRQKLYETIDVTSTISKEIANLHDDIRDTIETK